MRKTVLTIAIGLWMSVVPPVTLAQQPEDLELDELQVTERRASVTRSRVSAVDVQTLNGAELCKAACCNLSGSFETSASVDVAYADAATGAKQIRLLGLSGMYVQMLTENTPNIRGLAQSYGMDYIPGPWMDAIQVSKGTSSVRNGYESVTGQINVEYLKPQTANPVAVNAMLNKDLHAEANVTGAWNVSEHASTGVMVHADGGGLEIDHNRDGFLDMPRGYNVDALNRWYISKGHYVGQVLVRGIYDRRMAGHTSEAKQALTNPYEIDLGTWRLDGFMKNGIVLDHELNRSLGIITSVSYHDQNNHYGLTTWKANQLNTYLNAIFETDFDDSAIDSLDNHGHKLSTGLSINYDRYQENINRYGMYDLNRDELTSGVFAEYTYTYKEILTLLAGLRADYSTRYGAFVTPRVNVRYAPFDWWTLRGSVGMGYRTPNLIADNAAYLVSNRGWIPAVTQHQEKAVNAGVTMTFYIPVGKRELQLTGEYYHTRFVDAVITDLDRAGDKVYFYNMSDNRGMQNFVHNWQVEASMEILRGWTMTAAFRYTDARQSTYNTAHNAFELREKALQNRFKGIISTSYQTPLKKWQFDLTAQFNGPGRMPDGFDPKGSSQYYERDGVVYHTWYPQLMAQVTKYFRTASIYVGAENMTNFRQDEPVRGTRSKDGYIDPTMAGGEVFDASMVWAPIHGWQVYVGFRWALDRPDED